MCACKPVATRGMKTSKSRPSSSPHDVDETVPKGLKRAPWLIIQGTALGQAFPGNDFSWLAPSAAEHEVRDVFMQTLTNEYVSDDICRNVKRRQAMTIGAPAPRLPSNRRLIGARIYVSHAVDEDDIVRLAKRSELKGEPLLTHEFVVPWEPDEQMLQSAVRQLDEQLRMVLEKVSHLVDDELAG